MESMAISRAHAQARGKIGGLTTAARVPDRTAHTRPARDAAFQRFLDQVPPEITDPDERRKRAELLRRAHMQRLSLRASVARSKAAKARAEALAIEQELADAGDDAGAA